MRIGIGYDIHRLSEGEELILGGVPVVSQKGTVGHSDADVLIHAIIDALLGAAALGDIGDHFPPSDPAFLGISSRKLLVHVAGLLTKRNLHIGNIDCVVVLQEPRLKEYKDAMCRNIADDLHIDTGSIGIKAKTKEGLDSVGRLEAVEAHAVVLLEAGDVDTPPDDETAWV